MNKFAKGIKYFYLGLQFIFVVIAPVFLSIFIAGFLKEKFGLGDWITVVAILFGIFLMIVDAYNYGKFVLKQLEKDGKKNNGE